MKFERTKPRSKTEILTDILSLITKRPRIKKTHIMFGANLNHKLLAKYIPLLVRAGLVSYDEVEHVYDVTESGVTYLKRALANARALAEVKRARQYAPG
jgi:predicted transcriptional regulator